MTVDDLREWIETHTDDIFNILEFEPDDETLDHGGYFQYWLGGPSFDDAGYKFESIGQDGSGGKFAVWSRPNTEEPSPLVFFGSEGGHGVVANDFRSWPLMIAHGVGVSEYGDDSGPTAVHPSLNEYFDPDYEDIAEAKAALERYRKAAIAEFGELPDFDTLAAGREQPNAELRAWIASNNA